MLPTLNTSNQRFVNNTGRHIHFVSLLCPYLFLSRGVALYEVNIVKEYTVPTPKVVYQDIDVEIRLPKFVQVLPGHLKQSKQLTSIGSEAPAYMTASYPPSECGGSQPYATRNGPLGVEDSPTIEITMQKPARSMAPPQKSLMGNVSARNQH